ncbi:hypothetical protein ABGB17_15080 [Sphaerisporangium sp. B11E5]|uniref:hypothetical protein n=1 Tax=Sphaerisporangium sp. B11E5 TaxID=3153563 RepID=UPI00325DDB09
MTAEHADADVIEQGPGGPRWVGLVGLAALVAVSLIGVLNGRETSRPAPVATPKSVRNAISVTPNAVYPEADGAGGFRTSRVTFPHGARAELVYPARLNLASMGVRPSVGGTVDGEFRSLTAPLYGEAETAAGRPMLRHLAPNVTLWPGPPGVRTAGPVLLFAFGDWRLALQDERAGMAFEQRKAWAGNLRGTVTADGFLTLSGGGPLRLSRPGEVRDGVLVGPQLWLGGLSPRMLVVAPIPGCERPPRTRVVLDTRHPIVASTCRDGFYLAAAGDEDFVRRVLRDVRVRATG